MFNYPTKRQIEQRLRSMPTPAPISTTTAIGPSIKRAARERNTRVARELGIKQAHDQEKRQMTIKFSSDLQALRESHRAAIESLNRDCSQAKERLSQSAEERLRSLTELKDREIATLNQSHQTAVRELENSIKTKKEQIKKLRKMATDINTKLEKKTSQSSSEKRGDLETESALKVKLGAAEKETKDLKAQIKRLTDEKIGIIRMTDSVDKELKDSLNYLIKVTENDIRAKLLDIQKIGTLQEQEIETILDQNMTVSRDIENKSQMKLDKKVDTILDRYQEQKRLGNVQSKIIIAAAKKNREELEKKHRELVKDMTKRSEDKLKEVTQKLRTIESKLQEQGTNCGVSESQKKQLSEQIKKMQQEKRELVERFTKNVQDAKLLGKKELDELKLTHKKELDEQEKKLNDAHKLVLERIKKSVESSKKEIQNNLAVINNKELLADKTKREHLEEISKLREINSKKVTELEQKINKLVSEHKLAISKKDEIEAVLRNDVKRLKQIKTELQNEVEIEKEVVSKLQKQIDQINIEHSKKLISIKEDNDTVCAEIKKAETKKQEVINRLHRKCSEQAKQLTSVLTERSELKKKITKLECEVNQTKISLGISAPDDKHCKVMHSDLVNKLQELIDSNKKALKSSEKGSKDAESKRRLTKQLEELQKKFKQLDDSKTIISGRLQESQGKVYDKTMEITKMKGELEKIQRKLDKSKTESKEHQDKVSNLQERVKSILKDSAGNVTKLQTEIERINKKNRDLDFKIRGLTTDKSSQQNKIDKYECELEAIKSSLGMDTQKLKHCKVIYSKIEEKIKELTKQKTGKDSRVAALEKANKELTQKNNKLERMIPKMEDLEKQLENMKKAARANAVDADVIRKARDDLIKASKVNHFEQMKILEKAVYLPWVVGSCFGKEGAGDRSKCSEFERFGSKPKLNEIQKIQIKEKDLVRFRKGLVSMPSSQVKGESLKRKLLLIENTGFVTKEFKDECITKQGTINMGNQKCHNFRRNFKKPDKIAATGLTSL